MARLGDQDPPEAASAPRRPVAELQLVQPFQVERQAAAVPVQLDPQLVLAPAGTWSPRTWPGRPSQPGGEHRGSSTVTGPERPGVPPSAHAVRRLGQRTLGDKGGGGRGDAGDQLAGQVLGQVDEVRAQVAQRAGPGPLALQPPGQRERRVDQPVLEIAGGTWRTADLPRSPAGGQGQGRDAAVVEPRHRADPPGGGPLRRGRIASASARVLASGFSHSTCLPASSAAMATSAWLTPGVHTSTSCTSSRLIRACQSVSVAAQPSRPRRGARRGRVPAAQHGHAGPQRQVEHVRRGPPGVRVGRAHERVAHHAHAEHRRVRDLLCHKTSRQADPRVLGLQGAGLTGCSPSDPRTDPAARAG